MKISIYQINTERDSEHYAFVSLDKMKHLFGSTEIKSELYDKVFCGEIDCKTLEDVYRKFNHDQPDSYRGRSLSVSDVVEVSDADNVKNGFYFCDSFGYKEIGFEPEKTRDISTPDTIAVLYIAAGEAPQVKYIKPELKDMQQLVGGYIEELMPFDDEVAIICNEEGKLSSLPLNRDIYDESDGKRGPMLDIIAGNFFLANAPYESENFESLTPEMIKKYTKRFQYLETFMRVNGEILAVPIKPQDRGDAR